jgi:hypothetical protein
MYRLIFSIRSRGFGNGNFSAQNVFAAHARALECFIRLMVGSDNNSIQAEMRERGTRPFIHDMLVVTD